MQADIILVGQELLEGHIIDTNSAYLAQRMAEIGFEVREKTIVGDEEDQIVSAISRSMEHAPLVITSGGIGPTVDDRTRQACSRATGQPLTLNEELEASIRDFHQKRGQTFGENSRKQAFIPQGAQPIPNPVGTAPCFVVRQYNSRVVVLPGVPRELKYLTDSFLIPFLQKEFELGFVALSRTLHTGGVGESIIDRKIKDLLSCENPRLGLLASTGQVDIRLTAKAPNHDAAQEILDDMERRIQDRLGGLVFGRDEVSLAQVVVEMLRERSLDLSILETNTGGLLASRITAVPDGFSVMPMALTGPLKRICRQLDVFLAKSEPEVNQKTALALAQVIKEQSGTQLGLAVVGDEDPDLGPFKDQIGQTFIAVQGLDREHAKRIPQGGLSEVSRAWIINAAMQFLREYLLTHA